MRKKIAIACLIVVAGLSFHVKQASAIVIDSLYANESASGKSLIFPLPDTTCYDTAFYKGAVLQATGFCAGVSGASIGNDIYITKQGTSAGYDGSVYAIPTIFDGGAKDLNQLSNSTYEFRYYINATDYYVQQFTITGGACTSGCEGLSNVTRIIVTDPLNEEYVSTTTLTGARLFVNENDWRSGTYLSMNFTNNTVANGVGGFALEAWNSAFGEIKIPLNSGLNIVSTSTTFTLNGQVNAVWRIKVPNSTPIIGFFLPDQVLYSTSTVFIVGQRTALDIAMASTSEALITALLTGTTTSQSVIRCNPWDFDIMICLISLIIPPQSVLQNDFEILRDGFLSKWPLGYVTRMIEIFASSTNSQIPVISATIPSGVIGAGASITLDANHALDFILNATTSGFLNSSASSTDTLYEITSYYWELIVYACLGLYILRRILGSHLIGSHKDLS